MPNSKLNRIFDTTENTPKLVNYFQSTKNFEKLLLEHPKYNEPQALQGMFQAYGTIKASQIAGKYALIVTGIIGTGLFFYKQHLNNKRKELIKEKDIVELEKKKHSETFKKSEELLSETLYSLKIKENQFKIADSRLRSLYKNNLKEAVIYDEELSDSKKSVSSMNSIELKKLLHNL